jgi:hypothetical protein
VVDEGRRTKDLELLGEDNSEDSTTLHRPSSRIHRLKEGISRNVFVLGLVSFFTDVASEMIVPIRSLFLYVLLLIPAPIVGLMFWVEVSFWIVFIVVCCFGW